MTVPGQFDVEAAWYGLPPDLRDRIGIIAVDIVFQGFVYGDAFVVFGRPAGMPVGDEVAQGAACEAKTRRLNELTRVIEAALPDLFAPTIGTPVRSDNPGPRP
ncbi:hypothetical protein MKK68_12925 [Methylobacterium sp. E-016]|jgi:hypothetical protein|uniref:hypothetical protein n=1 Tax=Methylobacterium sp. E-016 TaxID=2836556 RepID=UPI001FBB57D7|nr:hypothetical protein [Methylobacterium sp. E-016]MCJ2076547.1 hypothetical protein [Methylobacterium sp. E-016]